MSSGKNKPGFSQEDMKNIKALKQEIEALSDRHSELFHTQRETEGQVSNEVSKELKLDEETSAKKLLTMKDFVLAKKLVALAGQCIHKKHNFVSEEPKNKSEPGGIYFFISTCNYCGVNEYVLLFAKGDVENERLLLCELNAEDKKELEKFELEEEQGSPNGNLGQEALKAEIAKIQKKKRATSRAQRKIFGIIDAAEKVSKERARSRTRKIIEEMKECRQKINDLERQLGVLQAKCKHKWTENMDVLKIVCKICSLPALGVYKELGSIPGGGIILPEDEE